MMLTAAEQLSPFSCQTFLEADEGLADKPMCSPGQIADFLKIKKNKNKTLHGE